MSSHIERNACAHQAHEDRMAADQDREHTAQEKASAELKAAFLLALDSKDAKATVPFAGSEALFGINRRKLIHQPLTSALWDALAMSGDHGDRIESALMDVVMNSKCLIVGRLRGVMSEAYADQHADGMVEFDLQQQRLRSCQ